MSTKRTSTESSNDEQTNEGSDLVFQQGDNAKRAKLASLSDTTLQDLPMELIECILIKAIAMEVKDTKLAKSVWKEKAGPVVSRLRTVCSQWSSILSTNFFRNELHRTLDRTAEKTIRLEILHQSPLDGFVHEAITFKDELLMIRTTQDYDHCAIHVYDRNNVGEVKDVIPLPGIEPKGIAACSVSDCLYILNNKAHHLSVLRITKTDEHQFNVSPLISDIQRGNHILSVAADGSLILLWQKRGEQNAVISIYDANGSLQHEIRLSLDTYKYFDNVIPKSNGNLVLVSTGLKKIETVLTEIDMNGTILRQYQSSIWAMHTVCYADKYGRILIAEWLNRMELLDSEFNLLNFIGPQLDNNQLTFFRDLHYNAERNEIVSTTDDIHPNSVLSIFRFIEE